MIYQSYGTEREPENTARIFTYRIIQELVNNAVKHAEAGQIFVQLMINEKNISIAVEDNGKGFDKSRLAQVKGAGMDNINYRVKYFNGTFDMDTEPGKGTSVSVQLNA